MLARELAYAVRSLRQHPGFLLTAAGTLAIGICANVTVFSMVNGVLLRPMPFGERHRPGDDTPFDASPSGGGLGQLRRLLSGSPWTSVVRRDRSIRSVAMSSEISPSRQRMIPSA